MQELKTKNEKKVKKVKKTHPLSIPNKANYILNIILTSFLVIGLRLWHLSIIQHDELQEKALRPRHRTIIEQAQRATIRDRFNIPIALNKIHYQASIIYSQIREIPTIEWIQDEKGVKKKIYKRKTYIKDLSYLLAKELQLDPIDVEDRIHSHAALYMNLPCILKESITEKEYFRLKMLEKDWLGIHAQRVSKRDYPLNSVGSHIIGYMGAINREEYETIISEIKSLKKTIADWESGESPPLPIGITSFKEAKSHLKQLKKRAYSIHDFVGKSGIEKKFEEELKGFKGKKIYYSDAKGNFLHSLPGSQKATPGERILLSISSELQAFAEELLIKNEEIRENRSFSFDYETQQKKLIKQPWIKSGAIVAIDPNNGDVLALASYPSFNPNDFVQKNEKEINRWLETESNIAAIWNQQAPLKKEYWDFKQKKLMTKDLFLNLKEFLKLILPKSSPIHAAIEKVRSVGRAYQLVEATETLISLSPQLALYPTLNVLYQEKPHNSYKDSLSELEKQETLTYFQKESPLATPAKKICDLYFQSIPSNYDKGLLVDICRLIIGERIGEKTNKKIEDQINSSNSLLAYLQNFPLDSYRQTTAAFTTLQKGVKEMSSKLYHDTLFQKWRKENQKQYLKKKRKEEVLANRYAKPYMDYLNKKEKKLFEAFWDSYKFRFILQFLQGEKQPFAFNEELADFDKFFLSWEKEITQGAHKGIYWHAAYAILKKSLEFFPLHLSEELLKTLREFQELNRSLLGYYPFLRQEKGKKLEKHLASAFYPLYGFGYGRSQAFRQSTPQGSIFKLVTAYEAIRQRYDKIQENEDLFLPLDPFTFTDQVFRSKGQWYVGLLNDGTPVPQKYKGGRIMRSLKRNFGKMGVVKALETSSNSYFALLASDYMNSPEDLKNAAANLSYGEKTGIDLGGEIKGSLPNDLSKNKTGLYTFTCGHHTLVVTPLQTAVMLSTLANGGKVFKPNILHLKVGKNLKEINNNDLVNPIDPIDPIKFFPKKIVREVPMPSSVQNLLFKGMDQVAKRIGSNNGGSLRWVYQKDPQAIKDFLDLDGQFIGKSSTAEYIEHVDLDLAHGTNKYNHIWFGGISFEEGSSSKDNYGKPELVVVVYLKFGGYGKEAAPIGAQMVKKWREIKEKYKVNMSAM